MDAFLLRHRWTPRARSIRSRAAAPGAVARRGRRPAAAAAATAAPGIFDPFAIKGVVFRSRVLRSSLGGRMAHYDGTVTRAWRNFERRFAKPEYRVGGIISATIAIDDARHSPLGTPKLSDDRFIAPMAEGVRAVQALGCRYIVQIGDPGGHTHTSLLAEPADGLSASAGFDFIYGYRNRTSPMTREEIARTVQQFADAARRVRATGADGVEVTASKGYLIHQFLNPATNRRRDEYGGSAKKRFRLLEEVVNAVRKAVGDDYLFGVRLSARRLQLPAAEPALAAGAAAARLLLRQHARDDARIRPPAGRARRGLPAHRQRLRLRQPQGQPGRLSVRRPAPVRELGAPPEREGVGARHGAELAAGVAGPRRFRHRLALRAGGERRLRAGVSRGDEAAGHRQRRLPGPQRHRRRARGRAMRPRRHRPARCSPTPTCCRPSPRTARLQAASRAPSAASAARARRCCRSAATSRAASAIRSR
ncbi:MAG: hypothetical protein U1F25_16250 [Rubrivivax sp.]